MKVIVDGAAGTVRAEDVDNLDDLSVELRDASAARATAVLGTFGRVEGEHAWLDIESLHTLAPTPRSCSWDERFAKAMAYARSNGWTDETGKLVQAHIEPSNAEAR